MKSVKAAFILFFLSIAPCVFAQTETPPPSSAISTHAATLPALYSGRSTEGQAEYPGSAWLTFGDQSPVEGSNIQLNSYVEQGVSFAHYGRFSLNPYASFGFNTDTAGYNWNNYIQANAGVKANFAISHYGVVTVGATYSAQDRFKSGTLAASPAYYISDWFGWNSAREPGTRLPGDTWGIFGHISPLEPGNYVFDTYIEQGVVASRTHYVTVVPIAVAAYSKDTLGYTWNNFVRPGAGVDFLLPKGMEVLAVYLHENRPGIATGEFTVTLKIWQGWTLGGKK